MTNIKLNKYKRILDKINFKLTGSSDISKEHHARDYVMRKI